MNKYWKIIIPLLLAMAIALGILQRKESPEIFLNNNPAIKHFNNAADSLAGYYKASQELSSNQNTSSTATFLAVGDIMLSRNVAATIKKSGDNLLPFRKMDQILKSTDFNFANLESPVASSNYTEIIGGHSLIFGAPRENIQGLKDFNFQIVNLANNHAFDQSLKGLTFTNNYLDYLNVKHIGTGSNLDEAWKPVIIEMHGIKIGFIGASFSSLNDGGKTRNNYVARIEDLDYLKSSIEKLKSTADFVVVTMHAGTEYNRTPNPSQVIFAHEAIADGADIVIGAHPHWVQTIEKYNDKYIFYSLGNFIFDQEWSRETKEGLVLKITVSKTAAGQGPALQGRTEGSVLNSIELIPVIIEDYSTPRPATAEESQKILQKIGQTNTLLYP